MYTPAQLLADLTHGIWTELDAEKPQVDLYRRNLQRAHVELLASQVNCPHDELRPAGLARCELQTLRAKIETKNKDLDPLTKAHLDQVAAMIDAAFDTRVRQVQSSPLDADIPAPRRGV